VSSFEGGPRSWLVGFGVWERGIIRVGRAWLLLLRRVDTDRAVNRTAELDRGIVEQRLPVWMPDMLVRSARSNWIDGGCIIEVEMTPWVRVTQMLTFEYPSRDRRSAGYP
jgi:hypothetical protein